MSADTTSLKRSLDDTAFGQSFRLRARHDEQLLVSVYPTLTFTHARSRSKRRIISAYDDSSMLAQPSVTMSSSFPSFMSVYDSEEGSPYSHALSQKVDQPRFERESLDHFAAGSNTNNVSLTSHQHSRPTNRRGSITSSTSYSTESSPTTTSSTFDSPLMAEMPGSPSSSPESASSAVPPKSFQSAMRIPETQIHKMVSEQPKSFLNQTPRLVSPHSPEDSKKNVKNLTLDMRLPTLLRPGSSAGHDGSLHPFSAPTSPLKTGRRKPTNLTIRTPAFNQVGFPKPLGEVPPTPSHTISLHQPLSSPSLPSLASPMGGPPGGMYLSLPNIAQHCNQDSVSSTSGSLNSTGSSLPSLREDDYQPPKSQEAQEQGYTEGPVRIYDSGVYLYLEPTAEEASKFDVVINCAKEIKDPFESKETKSDTIVALWRSNGPNRNSISEPQTAMSEISFKSAFEWPSANSPETPTATTPKAESELKIPEYLHVAWDHNSEILDDLYPLCQIIDDRVKGGKKVLIHCQLGVSRSASLIIAYGLYKGYESSFHSMYMTVKERSRWVGPNMTLIYQLNDFCSKCVKGDYPRQARGAKAAWWLHTHDSARTPTAAEPVKLSEKPRALASKTSTSSISTRPPLRLNKELPPVPRFSDSPSPPNTALLSLNLRGTPSPRLTPSRSPQPAVSEPAHPVKRSASRPLPLRERPFVASPMIIPPHRPRPLQAAASVRLPALMDLAQQDVPASPSLFSPRATEFVAQPFGITTAGDLVTPAPKRRPPPPPGAFPGGSEWRHSLRQSMDLSQDITQLLSQDPRSPHQQGETREIFRHIDGVL